VTVSRNGKHPCSQVTMPLGTVAILDGMSIIRLSRPRAEIDAVNQIAQRIVC
jgi:hypothetical protein